MRLLDRYLLREFLTPFGYCLGGFFVFWVTFQLFSEFDEFQKAGLDFYDIVNYFIATMPDLLSRVMPLSLLLAMLYALNNHARHNEIVAIRVAGWSLWRISVPYFLVSIICGTFLFCLNEFWMPDGAERAQEILRGVQIKQNQANIVRFLSFKNKKANRTWLIEEYNLDTYEMKRPHVEWVSTNKTIFNLIAERGIRTNNTWVFYNVQLLVYPTNSPIPGRGFTNVLYVPEFYESPELFKSELKIGSLTEAKQARGVSLSLREIIEYWQWNPEKRDDYVLNTKFHVRLAFPWTCPIIVLIALPFASIGSRRNVYVGMASSVFIAFSYFVLQRFGEAAGLGGHLTPWLAGWLPNIVFAVIGLVLTIRAR